MEGQLELNRLADKRLRSDPAYPDPKLGDLLASFAPQVTELRFGTPSPRRPGVTLAVVAACGLICLAGYELAKYLSRKREEAQLVEPDSSA